MEKIYCKNCKYRKGCWCSYNSVIGNSDGVATTYCENRNVNNNCEYYKPKKKWWRFKTLIN